MKLQYNSIITVCHTGIIIMVGSTTLSMNCRSVSNAWSAIIKIMLKQLYMCVRSDEMGHPPCPTWPNYVVHKEDDGGMKLSDIWTYRQRLMLRLRQVGTK